MPLRSQASSVDIVGDDLPIKSLSEEGSHSHQLIQPTHTLLSHVESLQLFVPSRYQ